MLHLFEGNRVYTVPEIDMLLQRATGGFTIVDSLPLASKADPACVYYVKKTVTDNATNEDKHVLVPYVIGKAPDSGTEDVWYTTGIEKGSISYEELANIPTINGIQFKGDLNKITASKSVEEGGYGMTITDTEIEDMCKQLDEGTVSVGSN